jgi:4-amino-4-deoxy-L-arabinose transferase-like glycosyltransferase
MQERLPARAMTDSPRSVASSPRTLVTLVVTALLAIWAVGMLGRGFWTPDEPREADIAWRMSGQPDKAVPLLAGEAFCEKPPLTYWLAAASINTFGNSAWAMRVPNLLYALLTALSVGLLARRAAGKIAGLAAAAAIATFLLSYQAAIWLATDAPLLAAVALALLGQYLGFYADHRRQRLSGYLLMHFALALGFLCKSAAAWMIPLLSLATLIVWERRWRELLRWELYVGLIVQAAIIFAWVWSVYIGPDGLAHLKVFFWNNLVGRFTSVDAPTELQYATAHRNSPGKYLLELPLYLWPWTLLCVAAARRAWLQRRTVASRTRAARFAVAVFVPSLAVLSVAATARNIYLAPALPGIALLLGWWCNEILGEADRWDLRALGATAILLIGAVLVVGLTTGLIGLQAWSSLPARGTFVLVSLLGGAIAACSLLFAWGQLRRGRLLAAQIALLIGYCSLLVGPASQCYTEVDRWQNLGALGHALREDIGEDALALLAPDETTRAWVDMYTRSAVTRIPGPIDAVALAQLRLFLAGTPHAHVLVQIPGRELSPQLHQVLIDLGVPPARLLDHDGELGELASLEAAGVVVVKRYALPNGRRYALLESRRVGFAFNR